MGERFGCQRIAITLRGSLSASRNTWAGMLYDVPTGNAYLSREYDIQIVDRVGGGDSFGGALIYALSGGYDEQQAIEFAVAAFCLKHTIEHDFNLVTEEEVKGLMRGKGSGRVQR
jgi:2-dehydro-3-deoxygluconokinase